MTIEWPLVLFTLFCCLGCGLFSFVCLSDLVSANGKEISLAKRKNAALVALGMVCIGGLASFFHLTNIGGVFAVLSNLGTEIGKELIFSALIVIIIAVYWATSKEKPNKIVAGVGIVIAILLGVQCGLSYVMTARPAWDTAFLPLNYLLSTAAFGAIAIQLFQESAKARIIAASILAVQALVLVPYCMDAGLFGERAILFGVAVVVGTVVPLVLMLLKKQSKAMVYSALACALIGGIAFRCFMWIAGTTLVYTVI